MKSKNKTSDMGTNGVKKVFSDFGKGNITAAQLTDTFRATTENKESHLSLHHRHVVRQSRASPAGVSSCVFISVRLYGQFAVCTF